MVGLLRLFYLLRFAEVVLLLLFGYRSAFFTAVATWFRFRGGFVILAAHIVVRLYLIPLGGDSIVFKLNSRPAEGFDHADPRLVYGQR